jgi:PTH1 family peptidyl-tRNA hydrolase
MNASGEALASLSGFFKTPAQYLLCAFDEINLPVGRIKLSQTGSAGGHNGLASVLQHCGPALTRLRIGIGGRAHPDQDLKDWVLGRFTQTEQTDLAPALQRACDSLDMWLAEGLAPTMNRFNQKTFPAQPEAGLL